MRFIKLDFEKALIYEGTGEVGEEYVIKFEVDNRDASKFSNITIRVGGTADVFIGPDYTELFAKAKAGDLSTDQIGKVLPESLKYVITGEGYKYYCIRDKWDRDLNRKITKLTTGQTYDIPAKTNFFLAMGQIEINNQTLFAPAQILADNPAQIKALTEDVCFMTFDLVD